MTEAQLHRAVAAFLRVALKPPTAWSTLGHGGGGRVRGAQLKAAGLQKGWPDLLVMHPNRAGGGPIVCGLELKAKAGKQSPEQRVVEESFLECRAWYVLCRSVEEVEKALRYVGVPLHATTGRAA